MKNNKMFKYFGPDHMKCGKDRHKDAYQVIMGKIKYSNNEN